jgi:hypothetical protein
MPPIKFHEGSKVTESSNATVPECSIYVPGMFPECSLNCAGTGECYAGRGLYVLLWAIFVALINNSLYFRFPEYASFKQEI